MFYIKVSKCLVFLVVLGLGFFFIMFEVENLSKMKMKVEVKYIFVCFVEIFVEMKFVYGFLFREVFEGVVVLSI